MNAQQGQDPGTRVVAADRKLARGWQPANTAPLAGPRRVMRRAFSFDELGVVVALVGMVVLIGVFHGDFLQKDVLVDTVRQAAFVAIVAYGMVYLLAMAELDLSVGGIYALGIVLAAKWMSDGGMNPWVAAALVIVVGGLLGLCNGVLANVFRVPVIIVTLGTLSLYRGLVTVVSNGEAATGLPVTSSFFTQLGGSWLGFPAAGWVVVGLGVVLHIAFTNTRFGAVVRAVGSNRRAAEFSGIPVGRVRLQALALVGALAAAAGVLSLAFYQGADPSVGAGFELQVIAAAIIGGTAVSGGSGTVVGALLGALIVAVINSGLVFFHVDSNWTDVITGAVILVAVGLDALVRRRRAERLLRSA